MDKDKLIIEIGSKLLNNVAARAPGLTHLVMVANFDPPDRDDVGMSGFAYFARKGPRPIAPRDFSILELVVDLRRAMARADKKSPWVGCLIRIARRTREITFDFEYDDANRWEITLANTEARAKELAPPKPRRPAPTRLKRRA